MTTTNKQYKISPYDMLFFGTGRPFSMEDESWTRGIFPPQPSTILGYLRTMHFENDVANLGKVNTDDDKTKDFQIDEFTLLIDNEPYYPIPFCFVKTDAGKLELLELKDNEFISNNNQSHILCADGKDKKESLNNQNYISKETLQNFLNGEDITKSPKHIDLSKLLNTEQRIGIAKDFKTGKAIDGRLYRMELIQTKYYEQDSPSTTLKEISFHIATKIIDLVAENPIKTRKLGGEGKVAFLENFELQKQIKDNFESENAIIYLATPAILKEDFFKDYGELQTIANDNFEIVGGWDMAKRIPKESKYAYPAGTVFYVQFESKEKLKKFKENNSKLGEQTNAGFGQYYIGKQKKKNDEQSI